jgi:hypothetical protein
MKTMKKYQTGAAVKGSKGAKASQIIAGISAAAAGAAGIGKNISNRRKAKKAAQEKAKMEASGKMKYGGVKKPLRKKQSGGMAGPLTENDSNYLDSRYPSTSRVRIPAAPQDYDGDNFNPGYGFNIDPIENEMKNRQYSEKGTRASRDFNTGSVYKKGGATKRMQKGGSNVIQSIRRNMLNNKENRLIDKGVKNMKAGNVEKGRAQFEKSDDVGYKRRHLGDKYKTGGMVNANAKVTALKVAGSKGVKSRINSKVSASKVAKGRTGGISSAPKRAIPKAQMGMGLKSSGVSRGKGKWMIDKPYERGSMGAGNSATKTTRSGDVKKTKTVTGGGMYPGSKGTITKTKTVGSDKSAWSKNPNQATGTVVKSKTKDISNERANRIINRKAQMGGMMRMKKK